MLALVLGSATGQPPVINSYPDSRPPTVILLPPPNEGGRDEIRFERPSGAPIIRRESRYQPPSNPELRTTESRYAPVPPVGPSGPGVVDHKPDMVVRWNDIALQAIRTDRTPPPIAARNLAMVHVAVYDAVVAVTDSHCPFLCDRTPPPGTSAEAAAATAAYRVLIGIYPEQKRIFDDALWKCFADCPAGKGRDDGYYLGYEVGTKAFEWRCADTQLFSATFTPKNALGFWQPTPPDLTPALLPGWKDAAPFATRDEALPKPPGPPSREQAVYYQALNEVRALGAKNSMARTPEQTQTAIFWADGAGTVTPAGHWNQIAQEVSRSRCKSLVDSARLFAMLNVSLADAGRICWIIKFHVEYWRPITAIRQLGDRNTNQPVDPNWEPLLPTPPFPSYTSGHSTFSGAAAAALAAFFGADAVEFASTSEGLPGVGRRFPSFSVAAADAGRSRIFGGIHFEFDNADGLMVGRAIGEQVCRDNFRPRGQSHEAARRPMPLPR
jgi:hypothetical protein